jgi:hypothetical protein
MAILDHGGPGGSVRSQEQRATIDGREKWRWQGVGDQFEQYLFLSIKDPVLSMLSANFTWTKRKLKERCGAVRIRNMWWKFNMAKRRANKPNTPYRLIFQKRKQLFSFSYIYYYSLIFKLIQLTSLYFLCSMLMIRFYTKFACTQTNATWMRHLSKSVDIMELRLPMLLCLSSFHRLPWSFVRASVALVMLIMLDISSTSLKSSLSCITK